MQGLFSGFGGIQGQVARVSSLGIGLAAREKLDGFAAAGAKRAFLEVTAKNEAAVRMYRRLGFRSYKTVYREVAVREAVASAEPVPDFVGVGL